ncbi:hypothetical protein TNIN_170181 [Trichonephila inaurata madagascariensis]|uniref:Uncharacterized protein n=1 Tax=Trichonephila inaurata madagascariensis TaxID=2747483 RepID=A0A8X6YLY6_9ARAC|nr:hypothetical protein TNIN_170181 [Trichonephila inaurata madagascariensis]
MTTGSNAAKDGSPVKLKPGRPKLKKNDEKAKLSAVGDEIRLLHWYNSFRQVLAIHRMASCYYLIYSDLLP